MDFFVRKQLISAMLVFFALLFPLALPAAEQYNKNFSFELRDVTVKDVFRYIEKNSEYVFLYASNKNMSKKVSVDVKDKNVKQILDEVLEHTGLVYEIDGKQIIVKEQRTSTSTDRQQSTLQQTKKVYGVVKDESGETIIGANVWVKDTTTGVVTDIDGRYQINLNNSKAILVFSYLGMKTQEIVVGDKSEINVVLKADAEQLDEVVVVGYGTQKKVNLTGAVASVKMDDVLGDRPVTNAMAALQGVVPGLQITNADPSPSGKVDLNVRGVNSINGGEPLVLVDNMPMDFNMVDPNDIESVNVLKDAAASAIYGARAAFGVILITTKKGSKGDKVKLNYNSNFAFSNAYNLPEAASPYYAVKGLKDSGAGSDPRYAADVDKWLELLKQYALNPSDFPDGYYTDEIGTRYYLKENDRVADMMDNFGFQHSHNVSFSGATEKTSYRVSLGMTNQDGILITDKDSYRRYNISSFVSTNLAKWLQVQADLKYTDSNSSWVDSRVWTTSVDRPSYEPISGEEINGIFQYHETPRTHILLGEPIKRKEKNLRALGRVIVTVLPELNVTGEYSFLNTHYEKRNHSKLYHYITNVTEVRPSTSNTKYSIDKNSGVTHSLNLFANYSKDWGKHSFSAMAGYNQEDYFYESNWISRLDLINNDLPSIGQATGVLDGGDGYSEYATRSLFYRLNYSYGGKYLFETNGRYDGSSRFPKKTRFGFFPSMSLAWRVSEEPFFTDLTSIFSNMKIRYSFGEIGNQSIGNYDYIPGMEAYKTSWLVNNTQVTTLKAPALVDPQFTWERVRTSNWGIDIGVLNQKLDFSFDYYIRNTLDMLAPGMELPSVLGAAAPKANVADLKTKGWEISLNWHSNINEFNYRIGFNLYDSNTYITKYDNEVGLLGDNNYRIGQKLGEIWGYETDRLYQESDFDENGKIKPGIPVVEGVIPMPGDVLYVDQNNDGIINKGSNTAFEPGDMKIIGNDSKRFQYGITGGFSYKDFDFSIFFQGVGKRDLWRLNYLSFPYYSEWSNIFTHQLDYWTPDNANAFYPRLYEKATGNTSANRYVQNRYLYNGAYCRLKNVTLSYTLPQKWYRKYNIGSIGVFFSGEDLWTHYNTPKGVDPEVDTSGLGWAYPNMRKLSFGINISL